MLTQQILNGLVSGMVYALFALGLTIIYGVHRILNLAHGATFTCGAFVGLYTVTKLGLPLWLAAIAAMIFSGLVSVAIDYVAFRPLRKRTNDELATIVSSMGANLILINLAQQVSGAQILNYPLDIVPFTNYRVFGIIISIQNIVIVVCALALVLFVSFCLFKTKFGAQVRAVAINERMALLIGINPRNVYFQTFFLAGALAGAAGVILGVAYNSVSYFMGDPMLLRAFAIVVLGGLGSVSGTLIASLFFGVVEALTVSYLSSQLSDAILFLILFLVLLIRPSGIFRGLHHEYRKA